MAESDESRLGLPEPRVTGDVPVEQALKQRHSVREFAPDSLSVEQVGQLLWAAQGSTRSGGYRTAPSAGALYPMEVYLVAGAVERLSPGVYRYDPAAHELALLGEGDRRNRLARAAHGQDWVREAPAVLVIAGVYARTASKYGQRAERYVPIEVGHAAQNVYLQCTASGLATVFVGAFDDDEVRGVLGLSDTQVPLALMPLGKEL